MSAAIDETDPWLMLRVQQPVDVQVLTAVTDVLAKLAKAEGRKAYIRPEGEFLSVVSLPAGAKPKA
jgi:hypothetical protein